MYSIAVRTWLRFVAPLAVLGAMAAAPLFVIVVKLAPMIDAAHARTRIWLGVALAFAAFIAQLATVAAVMPALRSVERGQPLSQWRAFAAGAGRLARVILPLACAVAAMLIGSLALVVPGLALLVMLALTGASDQLGEPLPSPLVDSVAMVRARFWRIAAIVAAALVINLVLANGGQLALLGVIPKKNPNAAIVAAMKLKLAVPVALALVSPLVACALAAFAPKSR
jgi:hypothetical protein